MTLGGRSLLENRAKQRQFYEGLRVTGQGGSQRYLLRTVALICTYVLLIGMIFGGIHHGVSCISENIPYTDFVDACFISGREPLHCAAGSQYETFVKWNHLQD